ncbi:MAG: cell division protein ZapA [Acetivibrionales bacterium]|nr:cell division protein ZapA [Clostridiaceae bacterium]
MAEKNKVTVRIAGNEYVLTGSESPEYIQRIALFVDRKVLEITRKNHLLSTSMASVLTAINMADELFKTGEELKETEAELAELKKKYQDLKEESQRNKTENVKLKERESQLRIELTRRETELKEVRNTINTISNKKNNY